MKRMIVASSVLALALLAVVFVSAEPVEAKWHGKKSTMNMESMEKMDQTSGMCCFVDPKMDMDEEKDGHQGTSMDHSKMENSSVESNGQMAMVNIEKEKKPAKKAETAQEAHPKKVKDPVCGMEVDPKSAAAKATYKDKTYYFCSVAEKEQFEKAPKKYVK